MRWDKCSQMVVSPSWRRWNYLFKVTLYAGGRAKSKSLRLLTLLHYQLGNNKVGFHVISLGCCPKASCEAKCLFSLDLPSRGLSVIVSEKVILPFLVTFMEFLEVEDMLIICVIHFTQLSENGTGLRDLLSDASFCSIFTLPPWKPSSPLIP